ncbi:MAG: tyrosine recombinase XerC [Bacteroides sp.]|nr:tyrosine recombinase XerC [Bacteroides sp.]
MLIDSFLDYLRYERNYSEYTVSSYGKDLNQFQEFLQGENEEFSFRQVTSEDVREWIVFLMDSGHAASSVNRKLSSLRTFFKYLLKQKEVEQDPLRKINGPKKAKPLPVFLKESEMNRLLDETDFGEGFIGCRDKLVIQMFYATGMRLSELIGLNDSDVDFSSSLLKVTGKRNKQRLIPFGDELKDAMLGYMSIRDLEVRGEEQAFFVLPDGKRITRAVVYELVRRNLSKVVTLRKRSPHVLRHTFATTMLNNDAKLGAVKELLGHATLAATEVYTHTTFEELKKVYKQAHPRS